MSSEVFVLSIVGILCFTMYFIVYELTHKKGNK